VQRADDFRELVRIAAQEIKEALGYTHAWLMIAEDESLARVRMIEYAGSQADLAWEVAPVLELLRRIFPENVMIDVKPGPALPAIDADRTQVDQVLMNLCINARDAMPSGGTLSVETEWVRLNEDFTIAHPWAKTGQYVLTTVSDSGIGMTKEVLERVFEPFFRRRRTRAGPGSVWPWRTASSRNTVASCTCTASRTWAPRSTSTCRSQYVKPALNCRRCHCSYSAGREHVLLAEDDDAVRNVTRRILENHGYTVTCAANGAAAMSCARTRGRRDARHALRADPGTAGPVAA
jgi:two-component system cell cycle sensor histidine kinase/response regulator CckA